MNRHLAPLFGLAGAVLVLGLAQNAAAQIPDKFTNLLVLPKDTSKEQLVQTMRAFSGALGVRCEHCHVPANPAEPRKLDFASDEKETKKVARGMMKMTHEINANLMTQVGRTPVMAVRCITCHHGLAKPEQLADVLSADAQKDGVDAALKKYGELREKYYGQAAYDFSAHSLGDVAEKLASDKNLEGALKVQEFNVKTNPTSGASYAQLGNLYEQKGDHAAAVASLEKAVALEPENPGLKRRLQELKGSPAPAPSPR